MKNKSLHTTIAYCFFAMALVLFISGCRTKKSATDFKQTETENVSVIDNSTIRKNRTIEEKTDTSKTETTADKSFFEAWMEIKSDEATFEDKSGNKWTFKNPQVNQKSSQTNAIAKSDVVVAKNETTTTVEENQQNDVKIDASKETKTDLQQKTSSKGKEPVWLYVVGAVFVGGFGYLILKRFSLI